MALVDLPADLPDTDPAGRELSGLGLAGPGLAGPELSARELADLEMQAVPRVFPLELPITSKRDVLRRGRQIGLVAARHFAPLVMKKGLGRALPPDAYARPLRRTFEDLGATFMKFG